MWVGKVVVVMNAIVLHLEHSLILVLLRSWRYENICMTPYASVATKSLETMSNFMFSFLVFGAAELKSRGAQTT